VWVAALAVVSVAEMVVESAVVLVAGMVVVLVVPLATQPRCTQMLIELNIPAPH